MLMLTIVLNISFQLRKGIVCMTLYLYVAGMGSGSVAGLHLTKRKEAEHHDYLRVKTKSEIDLLDRDQPSINMYFKHNTSKSCKHSMAKTLNNRNERQ